MHRMLSFFLNGLNHKSYMISSLFKNIITSNSSGMLRNINYILQKVEMQYKEKFLPNKHVIKQKLKKGATQPDWRSNIKRNYFTFRDNQVNCNLDQTEVKMMLKDISTFREDAEGIL